MSPSNPRSSEHDGTASPAHVRTRTRSAEDLRAIKRALLRAPLGPRAAEALASVAIELEERLAREARNRTEHDDTTPARPGA